MVLESCSNRQNCRSVTDLGTVELKKKKKKKDKAETKIRIVKVGLIGPLRLEVEVFAKLAKRRNRA